MKEKLRRKLEIICILNNNQREHKNRTVTVYGFSELKGSRDFVVDSLLKALALAANETGRGSGTKMDETDVLNLSDNELLEKYPFNFSQRSIGLHGLAVWNYE